MKNLISFIRRYWFLLVLFIVLVAVSLNNWLFQVAGTLIYGPTLMVGSLLGALILRNVFNRDTTDADADSGQFVKEWKAIPIELRVTLTVVQILAYFLGGCWIFSALIR